MAASDNFKQFDVVSNYSMARGPTTLSPAVQKQIMKEWRILQKDLPDSIFVRVFENHIDFLRAAIVGIAGTPYHDGLFFFNLRFPSDYPAQPPRVSFQSHGLVLNPNLHPDGVVCLSLLNTWAGKNYQQWNPGESTVLQILLSIQALVLNSRPYFNDPLAGILGWPWEDNSRFYNEDVFLLTCKLTVYQLRKPPRFFEEFFVAHFRRRAGAVLGACRAYAEGRVVVGEYYNGGGDLAAAEDDEKKCGVSRKFRRTVVGVYKELVAEFKRRGISVEGSPEVLEVETTSGGYWKDVVEIVKRYAFRFFILFVFLFCLIIDWIVRRLRKA